MTETNPDETAPANVNPTTAENQNEPPNDREREHNILQQVLGLLARPPPPVQSTGNQSDVMEENQELRKALSSMAGLLRDKTGQVMILDKTVNALSTQITSLKEVVNITKELLNVRNVEVKHLTQDISSITSKMDEQRQRHNEMLAKMDQSAKLNSALKEEYETQLKLFQDLREKYVQRDNLSRAQEKGEAS